MALELPPNVLCDIGVVLARQACPIHDARRDVAALNVAFGLRGAARLDAGPKAELVDQWYSRKEAMELLTCEHVTRAGAESLLASLGCVGRSGRSGGARGADVRRLVYRAHGDDSARWLSCSVRVEAGVSVPPWFAELWLPMHACRDAGLARRAYRAIARAWHDVLDAVECLECDGLGRDDAAVRLEVGRWVRDMHGGSGGGGGVERLVERLGSPAARRLCAIRAVSAENVVVALSDLEATRFGPGSIRRAGELPSMLWVPASTLDACVRFVADGGDGDGGSQSLLDALRRPECLAEAARELAASLGLLAHVDVVAHLVEETKDRKADLSDLDEMRAMVERFDRCGLVPEFSSVCSPETVRDAVTGATSDDLPLFLHRRSAPLDLRDAGHLRECFDRRQRLAAALEARGLRLRSDSRLCDAYVVHGEYAGPPNPRDGDLDDAELVVEMMAEMEFLLRATSYSRIRSVLGAWEYADADDCSEAAKRAAVHEFVGVKGMPASELPARLRAVAGEEGCGGLEDAWDEYAARRDAPLDRGSSSGDDDNGHYDRGGW